MEGRKLVMPNYRLDPATFENPTIYKTLPLIMARLEEMEKKDRNYISKFLIRFNRICKNISEIKDYQFKENVIDSFRQEYKIRCKRLYEHYEAYFVEHLENFIVTKLKRLKEAGKIRIEFREDKNWEIANYLHDWMENFYSTEIPKTNVAVHIDESQETKDERKFKFTINFDEIAKLLGIKKEDE